MDDGECQGNRDSGGDSVCSETSYATKQQQSQLFLFIFPQVRTLSIKFDKR
jgi:hypothetical protein